MGLKIIFIWWKRQTFGTFLKTLFFGKCVGSDEYGNKYYQSKKMKDGFMSCEYLGLEQIHHLDGFMHHRLIVGAMDDMGQLFFLFFFTLSLTKRSLQ